MAEEHEQGRRPFWKSWRSPWVWVPVLCLAALGFAAAIVVPKVHDVYTHAMTVRHQLQEAMPLASTAQSQILSGQFEEAQTTVTQMAAHTAAARESSHGKSWQELEGWPWVGENLRAVRIAAESTDVLVNDALLPATSFRLDSLAPVDGRVNVAALTELGAVVQKVAATVSTVRGQLGTIDRSQLVSQVSSGLDQLDGALDRVEPLIEPAERALTVLPGVLGEDAPRNYLVMVQNNAESRGTGGNPAALMVVNVTNGAISITQQASSRDFDNGRANPITALDPTTVALYGDKIGRYMQDTTLSPSFAETASIMRAFWADSFGTPIDTVVSIDPVALSYLLTATGPVTLPNGDVLTADNAVQKLLNQVYFDYDDLPWGAQGEAHDVYFAAAADAIFQVLTSHVNPSVLLKQLARAVDEGRIMYVPATPAEAEILGHNRITGELPADNTEITVLGAYVNDITEGKLNFYTDTAVTVHSDVCQATGAPSFTTTFTLTNALDPGAVEGLAGYISPAHFFPKGVVSSDLVLYGPVGGQFVSATLNGAAVTATAVQHLGRPAVKINAITAPGQSATVEVTFTGPEGAYGPIQVWHTPMVRATPVTIDAPGCPASE